MELPPEDRRVKEEMMTLRKLILLALPAITLVGLIGSEPASAEDTPESADQARQEVIKVSNAIDQALAKDDADALAPYLSDELEYTQQTGLLLSKADWLARERSKKIVNVALKHEIGHVHVFGNAAVLTGVSHSKVVFSGKVSNEPRRFTRTFVKQGGTWLLVAQHVCVIARQNSSD